MLLATDLDGTFLGGNEADKEHLYQLINNSPQITLVFVTGRGLQSVLSLFEQNNLLPQPAYIICDVGATIVNGVTLQPVEPIQNEINQQWPGKNDILQKLSVVKGLEPQQVPQHNRCSFFYNEQTDFELLQQIVAVMPVAMIVSAGKYVDILPKGVNKGTTLMALVHQLRFDVEKVLTAGDSFNDLDLFSTGYKSVVVANAEPGLTAATAPHLNVYRAAAEGTGGIWEGITYFDLL